MMRRRTGLVFVLGIGFVLACSPVIADECNYDQENQLQELRKVMARRSGGQLDEHQRRVSWSLPGGATLTYTYGGCTHLGSEVTITEPRGTPRNDARIFALAMELAQQHWDKPDAVALRSGLLKKRFQREVVEGRVFYNVAHEFYSEFYVSHEFANGMDRVTIAWVRNF